MHSVPIIETDRLILRPYRRDDFPSYAALFGERHPRLGDLHANLGGMYLMLADEARAADSFDRALAILDPLLPKDHPQRLHVMSGIATLERMRGNRDRAIALQREVLAGRMAARQEREVIGACVNLGTALLEGDHDEPELLAEVDELGSRGLAIVERLGPPGAAVTPWLLRIEVALRRGRLDEANRMVASAKAAAADPSAAVDKQLQALTMAVNVALARKDAAAGKAAIDEAELAVLRSGEILSLATELFVLAKARWELDYDRKRAIELARRAEGLLAKRKDHTGRLAEVRAWLDAHG